MLKVSKRLMIGVVIAGLVVFYSSTCFAAMTVEKVIANMERAYENQMQGIDDFTLVQKPRGGVAALAGDTTTYHKRAKVDGRVIYKTRSETQVMGQSVATIYDGVYNWSKDPFSGEVKKEEAAHDPTQIWRNLDPSETHYLGEEEVDGENTHVLKLDAPFKVLGKQLAQPPAGQEVTEEAEIWGKLWISANTWMPVRTLMVIKGKSIQEGKEVIMAWEMTMDLKDYRKVETMLIPYKTVVNTAMDMEMDTTGLSEEEKKEQEAMLEMMKQFMGGLGSFEIETTEVKVNTGLSDALFDGTKL